MTRARMIRTAGLAMMTMVSTAAAAQLPPIAETLIALEVAEARCTGNHQRMVARYRPLLQQEQAAALQHMQQAMAARYRQTHGDAWQAALASDLAAARSRLARQAGEARFCKQVALAARRLSGAHDNAPNGFRGMNIEIDMTRHGSS